jgi:hypothetical protein
VQWQRGWGLGIAFSESLRGICGEKCVFGKKELTRPRYDRFLKVTRWPQTMQKPHSWTLLGPDIFRREKNEVWLQAPAMSFSCSLRGTCGEKRVLGKSENMRLSYDRFLKVTDGPWTMQKPQSRTLLGFYFFRRKMANSKTDLAAICDHGQIRELPGQRARKRHHLAPWIPAFQMWPIFVES